MNEPAGGEERARLAKALWRFGRCDGPVWVSGRTVGAVGWVVSKRWQVGLMAEMEIERGDDRRALAVVLAKSSSIVAAGRRRAAGKFGATSRQGGDQGHEVSILIAMCEAEGR